MPEKKTLERARRARREGTRPTTQAGAFVREEIEHIREGKHGAKSTKQAIAIGLSKARRAGVKLGPPPRGSKTKAKRRGTTRRRTSSPKRSRAMLRRLKREPRRAASRKALSRQARTAARRRGPAARKASARKAAETRKAA